MNMKNYKFIWFAAFTSRPTYLDPFLKRTGMCLLLNVLLGQPMCQSSEGCVTAYKLWTDTLFMRLDEQIALCGQQN